MPVPYHHLTFLRDLAEIPYLVNLRYVILCGRVAASPRAFLRHSSHSEKLPAKHVTSLSPTEASVWLAIRVPGAGRTRRSGGRIKTWRSLRCSGAVRREDTR